MVCVRVGLTLETQSDKAQCNPPGMESGKFPDGILEKFSQHYTVSWYFFFLLLLTTNAQTSTGTGGWFHTVNMGETSIFLRLLFAAALLNERTENHFFFFGIREH